MTNTSESEPRPLVLEIPLRGPIPSKKNRHFHGQDGKIKIDLKIKQRLANLEADILSALLSAWQTTGEGMRTGCSLRCWIASSTPADDCWTCIPEMRVSVCRMSEPKLTVEIVKL